MPRTIRKLRRRFRILSVLPAAYWAYKQRHVLAGMAGFAKTVPDRMKLGRGSEVALAAKVNLALLREPSLKGADLRIGAVQSGDVCLEAGTGSEAAAERARRVIEQIPGVTSVRVDNCGATPAPTVVAGAGAVSDLADGAVESPTGDGEVPVRV
jgi:hypothetical protein